jgi:hypothetical protein
LFSLLYVNSTARTYLTGPGFNRAAIVNDSFTPTTHTCIHTHTHTPLSLEVTERSEEKKTTRLPALQLFFPQLVLQLRVPYAMNLAHLVNCSSNAAPATAFWTPSVFIIDGRSLSLPPLVRTSDSRRSPAGRERRKDPLDWPSLARHGSLDAIASGANANPYPAQSSARHSRARGGVRGGCTTD